MGLRVYIEGRWPRRLRECDKRDIGSGLASVETLGSLILYQCIRQQGDSSPHGWPPVMRRTLGCFGDMPCSI